MIQLFKILVISWLPKILFILKIGSCLAYFNIFCPCVSSSSPLPSMSAWMWPKYFSKGTMGWYFVQFPPSSLPVLRDFRHHLFQFSQFTKEADLESLRDFYPSHLAAQQFLSRDGLTGKIDVELHKYDTEVVKTFRSDSFTIINVHKHYLIATTSPRGESH